jgi:hypothetical protein
MRSFQNAAVGNINSGHNQSQNKDGNEDLDQRKPAGLLKNTEGHVNAPGIRDFVAIVKAVIPNVCEES